MYRYLSRWALTRKYMAELERVQEILYPAGQKSIEKRCGRMLLLNFFVSAAIVGAGLCLGRPTVYSFLISLSLCYIFQKEWVSARLSREEYRLLKQLIVYLDNLRHFYHADGMIEEAIYDAMEDADYEVSLQIGKIYDILILDDEEEVERYKDTAPDKYFVTLLALCFVTLRYGDSMVEERSLFLTNLSHLKEEVRIEILRREKVRYTFSGLVFLLAAPVFFLKLIEHWGIQNLPELITYYEGGYGILTTVIIFLFTVFSYLLVTKLKEEPMHMKKHHGILDFLLEQPLIEKALWSFCNRNGGHVYRIHNRIKKAGSELSVHQYLLQRFLLFTFGILCFFCIMVHMNWDERKNALHYTDDFQGTSFVSGQKEIRKCRILIETYVNRYRKEREFGRLTERLKERLLEEKVVLNEYMSDVLAKEIVARIEKYQKIHIPWYMLPCILFLGWLLSALPKLLLEIKGYFAKRELESEVEQFQTILLMLVPIERMNIETILSWMEVFSYFFRSSIEDCVDQFPYDNERALAELKEKEAFPDFVRIVENLEISDRVGLQAAFDELTASQKYYVEKRKQDDEISISNKGAVAKLTAYLPLTMTLGLYLIVPFVLESMNQLFAYLKQLQ